MSLSRRSFFSGSVATSLSFSGLSALAQSYEGQPHQVKTVAGGETYLNQIKAYGPLMRDPKGIIDLPEGFSYRIFSRMGQTMDDGLLVPGSHDGMGCFDLGGDKVALVRNHEIGHNNRKSGPFGAKAEGLAKIDQALVYDFVKADGLPLFGGTTTLIYDIKAQRLDRHYLSLIGTSTNCGGGQTPWGSWLTCEENVEPKGANVGQDHGYVFEVPAAHKGLTKPDPIKAMGRFKHEAVCIDPKSGIAYMTEDRSDGVFYRYLPNDKTKLLAGGRLQALVIKVNTKAKTDNRSNVIWTQGESFDVSWVDLDEPESPDDSLRKQAFDKGAAQFARGEGIHFGDGEIFFCCTSGGKTGNGQIMRYRPSPNEGQSDEAANPGSLNLFLESNDDRVFDYGDNLTVSPQGLLFVCEDRYSDSLNNHLRIISPHGKVATFARNTDKGNSEWAGVCFSPDGSTLFANIQTNGYTVAITGPWDRFDVSAV
jgi:uncharacterized protein